MGLDQQIVIGTGNFQFAQKTQELQQFFWRGINCNIKLLGKPPKNAYLESKYILSFCRSLAYFVLFVLQTRMRLRQENYINKTHREYLHVVHVTGALVAVRPNQDTRFVLRTPVNRTLNMLRFTFYVSMAMRFSMLINFVSLMQVRRIHLTAARHFNLHELRDVINFFKS